MRPKIPCGMQTMDASQTPRGVSVLVPVVAEPKGPAWLRKEESAPLAIAKRKGPSRWVGGRLLPSADPHTW